MITPQAVLLVFQLFLAVGNSAIMLYALSKFLTKPHDTLTQRVSDLEAAVKAINISLEKGNERFADQDEANTVMIKSLLALIAFEMQYCLTENKPVSDDLKRAKDDLNEFLSKR